MTVYNPPKNTGGTLSLETNGTPNGSQTLLNLVAGSNITITDDGVGGVTFDSSGGSGPWMTSGSDIYNSNSGNVGIGTSSPSSKLDILGKLNATYNFVLPPTGFTASLTQETPISAPTATASLIYGPNNVTGATSFENIGSAGYTCNGQTNTYNIYAYDNFGTLYASNIADVTSVTDSVNDGTTTFSVSVSWSVATNGDGTSVSGYIVSGPFGVVDVGASTSYTDDSTPQSASFTLFGGLVSAGQTENFSIYNFSASPDYYSANGGNYSVTDSLNNGSVFWIQHIITGTPATAFQINDLNEQQYAQTSAGSYIQRGALGTAPINVSPQLIQSDGTTLNRDYHAYATDSGGTTFSTTFLDSSVTDPNDGNWYFITLSSSGPVRYKYLRNINGAGFNDGQFTTATNFYDDASQAWADGTSVSPQNSPGQTARLTNGNTTILGVGAKGQLMLNAEGVFAIPLLQWASNGSITGAMGYYPNTGRMLIAGSGGMDMYDFNIGDVAAIIGNATTFNPQQKSSASFKISTQNYQSAIEVSNDHVQLNVGSIGVFGATPVAQPTTAGGSASFTVHTGTAINTGSTFDGYTLEQVVKALRDLGLLA